MSARTLFIYLIFTFLLAFSVLSWIHGPDTPLVNFKNNLKMEMHNDTGKN